MKHLQEQFDGLNVRALSLADDVLKQIAESASCTGVQTCRVLQKTLQKAEIPQTKPMPEPERKKPVLRGKRKLRIIAAAAAAAVTAAAGAFGVSGRLRYNQPLAEANFGVLGAARLEEMDLPEPVTYTNGLVNATVEAALSDGNNVLVLMTLEAVAPETKIDWSKELYFAHEKGRPESSFLHAYPETYLESGQEKAIHDDECWISLFLKINQNEPADSFILEIGEQRELDLPDPESVEKYGNSPELYEDPSLIGETDPVRNRYTGGLEIEIPLTVNTPVLEMKAEDGVTVFLSGFEMYSEELDFNAVLLEATWNGEVKACRTDGTEMMLYAPTATGRSSGGPDYEQRYLYAQLYQVPEGKKFRFKKPETFNGLFDITDVTSMEFAGVTFYRTES